MGKAAGRRLFHYNGECCRLDIFVYSDESGVFDKIHNRVYVYGGIILLGKDARDEWTRRYIKAEKDVRSAAQYAKDYEVKACKITNKEKSKLYRSLNKCIKFGVVIEQKNVLDRIFKSKKDKQRFLDYAYKIGLKRAFEALITQGLLAVDSVENIHVYVDEHTTATNGCYELREGLEQELKNGTYNYNYGKFFPPVFCHMKGIDLHFCNSKSTTLVRAADIVANKVYCNVLKGNFPTDNHLYISKLP